MACLVTQVFLPSALAAAGVAQPQPAQLPPEPPARAAALSSGDPPMLHSQPAQHPQQAEQQVCMRRPLVPRLQLSSISLQELQAQASPTPQPPAATASPRCGPHAVQLAAAADPAGGAQPTHWRQQSSDSLGNIMAPADGTAALAVPPAGLGDKHSRQQVAAPGQSGAAACAEAAPSPASSVQQSSPLAAPPLTSRRAVSPAQQELLATARQWQRSARASVADAPPAVDGPHTGYPPPLPSARGSARGPTPPSLFARTGAAAAAQRGACPPGGHTPPRTAAAGATPRRAAGALGCTGGLPGTLGARLASVRGTYGHDPTFQQIKAAYNAGGWAAWAEPRSRTLAAGDAGRLGLAGWRSRRLACLRSPVRSTCAPPFIVHLGLPAAPANTAAQPCPYNCGHVPPAIFPQS